MYEKLKADLKTAMKEKNDFRKTFYKNFKSKVDLHAKEALIEVNDDVVYKVSAKQVKDNLKAIKEYSKHGREDLVKKLERENKKYKEYSAPTKSIEETNTIIDNQFAGVDVTDCNVNILRGNIMKNLAPMKNELDWNYVVETVNEKINDMVGTVI